MYYEIVFGSGFYDCYRYITKTDYPTTDYGALVDALIDYLKEKGHRNLLDDYEMDDNGYVTDPEGNQWYADEYVIGGNCGDVLLHYGDFRINEISESEIKNEELYNNYIAEIIEVD